MDTTEIRSLDFDIDLYNNYTGKGFKRKKIS